ncbi:30S ribosome-binding factor RbfA [Fontimonas sp. SYSU GA230001]|uniref:30S ribosome-binding factor RbfA n=1 Tax=Fontimonas sp. SYSU GA230001 TaxID=3142450 RepID=UPI0032B46E40
MKDYPRKLRIGAQIHSELAALVRDELSDPRVADVTITSVDVSPDLRNARVLVSLLGDDQRLADAVEGLQHAAGRLRGVLGRRLSLRYVPQLRFAADVGLREGDRLNALIRDAVRRDAEHHDPSND